MGKNKYSYEYVFQYFKDRNCRLLSKEYINAITVLDYICSCGRQARTSFGNFQNSGSCKECGFRRIGQLSRNTLVFAKSEFLEGGCLLLATKYKNCNTPMLYICNCGKEAMISLSHFQRGQRCKECGIKKLAETFKLDFEYISNYVNATGCEYLQDFYINYHTPFKYKCECGNISKITFASFQKGSRCKQCGIRKVSRNNNYQWISDREQIRLSGLFRGKCYLILNRTLKLLDSKKKNHTHTYLGYSSLDLQNYITNHPNWVNCKYKNWHLDHIYPIAAFIACGIYDISLINSLENLQPLLAEENISKSDKYNKRQFKIWLKSKGIKIE